MLLRLRHLVAASGAALSLLTLAPTARATPAFPAAIQERLALQAPPACTLCHEGGERRGTVTTPVGTVLRARGLQAYDVGSLERAIGALEGERHDADGDGVSDLDELRAGTDPNVGATAAEELPTPDYGCRVSAVGARPRSESNGRESWGAVTLLAVAWAITRRRGITARAAREP
jgi:hypothetical protein